MAVVQGLEGIIQSGELFRAFYIAFEQNDAPCLDVADGGLGILSGSIILF